MTQISDERLAELIEKLMSDAQSKWGEDTCMTGHDDIDTAAALRQFQELRGILESYRRALEGVPEIAITHGGWNVRKFARSLRRAT